MNQRLDMIAALLAFVLANQAEYALLAAGWNLIGLLFVVDVLWPVRHQRFRVRRRREARRVD